MTIDWAMQEALEEVDAITPACAPVAPRRITPAEVLAMNERARLMANAAPSLSVEQANQANNALGYFVQINGTVRALRP